MTDKNGIKDNPMFCEVIFDTNLIVVSEKIITSNPIMKVINLNLL